LIATRHGLRARAGANRACDGAARRETKIFLVGGEQALDALLQATEIMQTGRCATLCRIGVTYGLQPAVELVLDDAGILKQFADLGPHDRVEPIWRIGRLW
jgi:hypothetical protein